METNAGRRYAVIGAGRQGIAAAHDLLAQADTVAVVLVDRHKAGVTWARERLQAMLAPERRAVTQVEAVLGDAADPASLAEVFGKVDAVISGAPYRFNLGLARQAVNQRKHFIDFGGNTRIVLDELALGDDARDAGVSLIPDCGLAPGLAQTLAAYGIERLRLATGAEARRVRIYCGGLPQEPRGQLGYRLLFSIQGLTNEYTGAALVLRQGERREVAALEEAELVDTSLGQLEAFITSGGSSTAPLSFELQLDEYSYKTLRYPGHLAGVRAIAELGLLDLEPVEVAGLGPVVPRRVFEAIAERRLDAGRVRDVCILRAVCSDASETRQVVLECVDRFDERSGLAAMERLTGFHGAIVAAMAARGELPAGGLRLEREVPAVPIVQALRDRGFVISEEIRGGAAVTLRAVAEPPPGR